MGHIDPYCPINRFSGDDVFCRSVETPSGRGVQLIKVIASVFNPLRITSRRRSMSSSSKDEWEKNTLGPTITRFPQRREEFITDSGLEIDSLYLSLIHI